MKQFMSLLPIIAIIVLFYFLILRPAKTQQRKAMELRNSLEVGQEVMTTSGLYGTVVALDDDIVELNIGGDHTTRWAKQAIASIVTKDDEVNEVIESTPDNVSATEK